MSRHNLYPPCMHGAEAPFCILCHPFPSPNPGMRSLTPLDDAETTEAMLESEAARLRRRVETLEGRLARVLAFAFVGGGDIRWMRGRVWSGRRAGRGTKP